MSSERGKLQRDLAERVKELTALHAAARILQEEWKETQAILTQLVAIVPPAMQYPQATAARIRLGDIVAATPGFDNASSIFRSEFTTVDGQPGGIEIGFTQDYPSNAEGPFLKEEHDLIHTLSDMLRTAYDRRQAEMALRESEERFRQLTENIREVFWMRRLDTDQILYASPAYESVWGRTRGSLYSDRKTFLDSIHPEDQQRVFDTLTEPRESGFEIEYRIMRPDGQLRWIWDRGFPIKDDSGRVYRFAGIAEDITGRKQADEELRRTTQDLRALSENILSAREQEGTRIAREIHDELGSALTSLKWDLEGVDKAISTTNDQSKLLPVRKRIEEMTKLMDTTINVVRRIASELRPSVLDDLGLGEALEWQAQQFQERTGIICKCDSSLPELNLSQEQAIAIFRIFQEALTNVLRHAQATHVRFVMQEDGEEFRLTITDNGRGITDGEKSGQRSLGLLGMRERAYLIGGTVDISGSKGKGTVVTVRVRHSGRRQT